MCLITEMGTTKPAILNCQTDPCIPIFQGQANEGIQRIIHLLAILPVFKRGSYREGWGGGGGEMRLSFRLEILTNHIKWFGN